ncbi:hypothetical protein RAA17_20070 [Komagataeibacter rhaeticus]|nr:hypothetical protein [Komagataeibacter rhaeticus]
MPQTAAQGVCRVMTTDPATQSRPVVLLVDDEAEILVALTDLLEDTFTVLSTTSPPRRWTSWPRATMWT